MGRGGRISTSFADIGFESAVHRQPAPIAIIAGEQGRFLIILFRPDGLGDERASAIGADDKSRSLDDGSAMFRAALNADRASILE